MKKMNFLLLWALMGIAIIVMTVNHFQLRPNPPISLSDSAMQQALFVCPANDVGFAKFATQITAVKGPLSIIYTFIAILWILILGWVIYNSMLADKFERKSYDLPIFLGKFLVFSFVIATILMYTPNHFRTVSIAGTTEKWTLCEADTPGAKAIKKDAVSSTHK